jgi:hypothetical protein
LSLCVFRAPSLELMIFQNIGGVKFKEQISNKISSEEKEKSI